MKPYKLKPKFYIYFILILLIPLLYLNKAILYFLNLLPQNNFINYLKDFGFLEAPTVIIFLLLVFYILDKWLWKIKPINHLLKVPRIEGRYEGKLVSSYDESKDYKIVVEIRQSLTNISISLFTKNSSSSSIISVLGKNEHGGWSLCYVYENKTSTVNHDKDMKNHEGTALLDILDNNQILKGYYFDNPRDRRRYGTIKAKYTNKILKNSFK